MKVLILGAGYGTRLEKDLKESKQFTHLIGKSLSTLRGNHYIFITYIFYYIVADIFTMVYVFQLPVEC